MVTAVPPAVDPLPGLTPVTVGASIFIGAIGVTVGRPMACRTGCNNIKTAKIMVKSKDAGYDLLISINLLSGIKEFLR
jgi:hypothetical protein